MYTNRWRKLSFALIQYNINNNPDIIYEYDYIYIDYMYAVWYRLKIFFNQCWNNGMPPGMPECGGSSTQVRKNTINRSTVPVRTGAVQQGKNYRE